MSDEQDSKVSMLGYLCHWGNWCVHMSNVVMTLSDSEVIQNVIRQLRRGVPGQPLPASDLTASCVDSVATTMHHDTIVRVVTCSLVTICMLYSLTQAVWVHNFKYGTDLNAVVSTEASSLAVNA